MDAYQIKAMIIDDGLYTQETVTADFTHEDKDFSITFDKSDLEIINAWHFEKNTSVPANLSDELIESIRQEVKNRI